MKSKDRLSVIEYFLNRALENTNVLCSSRDGRHFKFERAENFAQKIKLKNGTEVIGYGLVVDVTVREEGKQPIYKKLFDRSYLLGKGRGINDVRLEAHEQLLDIMTATFLLTAYQTPVAELKQASTLEEDESEDESDTPT